MTDRGFLAAAVEEAKKAPAHGDVPVGAVITKDGKILCAAHNRREETNDTSMHAEMIAVREACRLLGAKDLSGCAMYVTLEPCPMCAGAIFQSGIDRLVFGAYDSTGGAVISRIDYASVFGGKCPQIIGGLCQEECSGLLKEFFATLRKPE